VSTERIVVGIDVGTTKVCTLVGQITPLASGQNQVTIIGVGIEPSEGMHKGMVTDVEQATHAITTSKRQAERTSGYEIGRAIVSLAGSHVASLNSKGVAGLNARHGVTQDDIERAMEAAQAVVIPHNREVLHVVPRLYTLDGQEGVRQPLGMHGFRLEVEAHIITASSSSVQNLEQCVAGAGVAVDRFVLNPLASAEVALTDAEREMGVVVIDIGGGTTDMAIFIEGTVWHTAVISVGGNHVTNDVAHGLRLPFDEAERVKLEYGHAVPEEVASEALLTMQPFGEDLPVQVPRADLAMIIEARVEEIFALVMQEIKRSGYDGLLPAGVVLTGGSSALPGIRQVAARVFNLPVRIAQPENLVGLVDKLVGPAYSTSVGLLHFALRTDLADTRRHRRGGLTNLGRTLGDIIGRFLPD
jgi:cell division protein FtsA